MGFTLTDDDYYYYIAMDYFRTQLNNFWKQQDGWVFPSVKFCLKTLQLRFHVFTRILKRGVYYRGLYDFIENKLWLSEPFNEYWSLLFHNKFSEYVDSKQILNISLILRAKTNDNLYYIENTVDFDKFLPHKHARLMREIKKFEQLHRTENLHTTNSVENLYTIEIRVRPIRQSLGIFDHYYL